MGRPKKELKMVHRKKVRKAKEKVKAYNSKEISLEKLPELAKKLLKKQRKQKKKA